MSDRKTVPGPESVAEVLDDVADERRRADAYAAVAMMSEVSGVEPTVWAGSMIGFGRQPYTTADGVTRDYFAIGLAARKTALTLYGLTYDGSNTELLERLGPHTTGKGCLYVKRLEKVDLSVLRELVELGWKQNHTPA